MFCYHRNDLEQKKIGTSNRSSSFSTCIAVGIDLGTTSACIATCRDDVVEIITNAQGNNSTPCYVSFTEAGCLVGDDAKRQMDQDPSNVVFGTKRWFGRKYDEKEIQPDSREWPFTVFEKDGKHGIRMHHKDETKEVAPEEISVIILKRLKEDADSFLGANVTKAVITVPAYFTDVQRQATNDAAKQAGWEPLRVTNESMASAIAYGLDRIAPMEREKNVLFFHLGGGTLNITHLVIEEGIFELLATVTDSHLGGDVFTGRLVDYFAREFEHKFDKDLSNDTRARWQLWTACEKAKCSLSTEDQASIEIQSLCDGIDFHSTVSRSLFEELNEDLFISILQQLHRVLKSSKLRKELVEEIVLSGGSTHIPKIREMVSEFFDNLALLKSIPPKEVVAHGAAVQAAIFSNDRGHTTCDFCCIFNVVPLSLGIETSGGIMTTTVRRNTTMPTKKTEFFTTVADNQTSILLQIYEGERIRTSDNRLVGQLELGGIPPAARGVPRIEVVFDIDPDGILTVSALESTSGLPAQLAIIDENNNSSKEEIERMVIDGEQHQAEDEAFAVALGPETIPEFMESTTQQVAVWSPPLEAEAVSDEIEEVN